MKSLPTIAILLICVAQSNAQIKHEFQDAKTFKAFAGDDGLMDQDEYRFFYFIYKREGVGLAFLAQNIGLDKEALIHKKLTDPTDLKEFECDVITSFERNKNAIKKDELLQYSEYVYREVGGKPYQTTRYLERAEKEAAAADAMKKKWGKTDYVNSLSGIYIAKETGAVTPNPTGNYKLGDAKFSYSRDFNNTSDTWDAEAAAMLQAADLIGGNIYGGLAGIEIHRVDTSENPADEVNELSFRGGLFYDVLHDYNSGSDAKPKYITLFHLFSAIGFYDTDLDFDAELTGAELAYTLTILDGHIGDLTAIGDYNPFTGKGELGNGGLFPELGATFAHVLDRGDNSQLEEEEEFIRLYAKVRGEYVPPIFDHRIRLTASAGYMFSPAGSPPNGYLVEAGMEWLIYSQEFQAGFFIAKRSQSAAKCIC
jgi:hypothetical protein